MRNHNQYRMQFAIMLSLIVLVTISGTARSADSPSGQEPSKPASNHVDNTKSDVKAVGIRDHLQLQPVTSEQFKLAGKANKKSSPRVREHLNLQPLTSDDFKSGKRKSSAPTGSAKQTPFAQSLLIVLGLLALKLLWRVQIKKERLEVGEAKMSASTSLEWLR